MLIRKWNLTCLFALAVTSHVCFASSGPVCSDSDAALRVEARRQFAISPTEFRKLPDVARWLIVDLRSDAAFAEFRIPTSIHMSAGQLKHTAILKGRKVLLVTEGYRDALAEREASKIEDAEEVRLLDGGLHAWWSQKLPLDGTTVRARELNRVAAADFLADAQAGGWKVIWIASAAGKRPPNLPLVVDGTVVFSPKDFRRSLQEMMKKVPASVGTLIVTDSEAAERKILSAMGDRLPGKVFLLAGGPTAMANQPSELTAALVKKSSKRCETR